MASENTTLLVAGVIPGSTLAAIVAARADIMAFTQATQDAVLQPRLTGGISHAERAALACRMARLHDEQGLAEQYAQLLVSAEPGSRQLADPAFDGAGEPRLAALLRHVDLVTQAPQKATRAHITALREAGITEDDIVRLAELIAFINYQLRVVAGLRLLGEIV